MGGSYSWPGSVSSNPSIGTNGAIAPTQSTQIAGEDPSGKLTPISTDADGNVNAKIVNDPVSEPVPTDIREIVGAAPSATNSLPSILTDGTAFYDAREIRALTSTDVVTAEQGGAPWDVSVSSSALPTGAATEATLSSLDGKVTTCDTDSVTVVSSALPTGAATEATLSTLNGKVTACDTGAVVVASSALPAGAATETTLSSLNGKVTACNTGAVTISAALPAGTNNIGSTNSIPKTPTAGTVTQAAVTVGTSAVRCTTSGSAPSSSRVSLVVTPDPTSAATFYIGSSSVANSGSSRGIAIVAGQSFIANLDAGDYYVIASAASQTVFIMEQA